MNVSSAIVKVRHTHIKTVMEQINATPCCEVHLQEGPQIIITISAEKLDTEINTIRVLEQLAGVMAVEVIYSYSADELNANREKIDLAPDHPLWLNDTNTQAQDIRYNGDLRDKKKRI